jgi:hypothetical protein
VPTLASAFAAPALIVHDRHDDEVPLGDGAAIAAAWPGAELLETVGLGHFRLLRDAFVIERVAAFVSSGGSVCACGAQVGVGDVCESCQVERELFDREARWRGRSEPSAAA